ncbi:hypothetical protein ACHAWF_005333 [Thalassiosira exigua]
MVTMIPRMRSKKSALPDDVSALTGASSKAYYRRAPPPPPGGLDEESRADSVKTTWTKFGARLKQRRGKKKDKGRRPSEVVAVDLGARAGNAGVVVVAEEERRDERSGGGERRAEGTAASSEVRDPMAEAAATAWNRLRGPEAASAAARGATDAANVATKEEEEVEKIWQKDVVLTTLEGGDGNRLVVRAMRGAPRPRAEDHVVVKVEASTVSARDCALCKGIGLSPSQLPFVPGFVFVGKVKAFSSVASDLVGDRFREGDRVAGIADAGGGCNGRFVSVPVARVVKISDQGSDEEDDEKFPARVACLLDDYMAAYRALRLAKGSRGDSLTGMRVLIADGFAPAGQAALELANLEGADVHCCARESKRRYLTSRGATCVPEDMEAWLLDRPDEADKFDVVIDNACREGYSASWNVLAANGVLVCLGPIYADVRIDGGEEPDEMGCGGCTVNVGKLHHGWEEVKAKHFMARTRFLDASKCYDEDPAQFWQDLKYLLFLMKKGDVDPKVAERVSLDDVPDAQRLMWSERANGTVVCTPW